MGLLGVDGETPAAASNRLVALPLAIASLNVFSLIADLEQGD
jgi:hypothetical protein